MGERLTMLDLARTLVGRKGESAGSWGESAQGSKTRHGTATSDSANGRVSVRLDGSEAAVSLACDVDVKTGDRVTVVSHDGTYKVIAQESAVEEATQAAVTTARNYTDQQVGSAESEIQELSEALTEQQQWAEGVDADMETARGRIAAAEQGISDAEKELTTIRSTVALVSDNLLPPNRSTIYTAGVEVSGLTFEMDQTTGEIAVSGASTAAVTQTLWARNTNSWKVGAGTYRLLLLPTSLAGAVVRVTYSTDPDVVSIMSRDISIGSTSASSSTEIEIGNYVQSVALVFASGRTVDGSIRLLMTNGYATKSELAQTATEISAEVSASIDSAFDMTDSTSKISMAADSIMNDVSTGYLTKTDAENTYLTSTSSTITQLSNSITSEVSARKAIYATCSTAAGTKAKVGTCANFKLYTGATVIVKFSNANTHATPTLNVNSTGAKEIRSYSGAALAEGEYKWKAGAVLQFVYDGTYWRLSDAGMSTRVTQTEASLATVITDLDGVQTLIYDTTAGTLVTKKNQTIGALVGSNGSFTVVRLTWSNGVPTIGTTVSQLAAASTSLATGAFKVAAATSQTTLESKGAMVLYANGEYSTIVGKTSQTLSLTGTSTHAYGGLLMGAVVLWSGDATSGNYTGATENIADGIYSFIDIVFCDDNRSYVHRFSPLVYKSTAINAVKTNGTTLFVLSALITFSNTSFTISNNIQWEINTSGASISSASTKLHVRSIIGYR